MTALQSILSILRNRRGAVSSGESLLLKMVSLLIAVILWLTILSIKRDEVRKNVKLEPILRPGTVITNKLPQHIQFTLSGPRYLLKNVERRIQPIRLDLRRSREISEVYPISEDFIGELPPQVRVVAYYPTSVRVRLDEVAERLVPVKPTLRGTIAPGYVLSRVTTIPDKIWISGPKSQLGTLDAVGTEPFDVEQLTDTKEGIVSGDLEGLSGFQLSREKVVRVKVTVRRQTLQK